MEDSYTQRVSSFADGEFHEMRDGPGQYGIHPSASKLTTTFKDMPPTQQQQQQQGLSSPMRTRKKRIRNYALPDDASLGTNTYNARYRLDARSVMSRKIPSDQSMIHSWIGLFLTSLMVILSALDETIHCNEIYQVDDGDGDGDDNNNRVRIRRALEEAGYDEFEEEDYKQACVVIFKSKVLVPACVGMILSGLMVSYLIYLNGSDQLKAPLKNYKAVLRRQNRARQKALHRAENNNNNHDITGSGNGHPSSTPPPLSQINISSDASVVSNKQRDNYSQRRNAPLLGFVAFLCTLAWGREIFVMMMHSPWKCQGQGCEVYDEKNDMFMAFRSSNTDELQSLGAVNAMGEVGANANLFYGSWISFILSASLCYGFSCSPFVHHSNALDRTTHSSRSIYRLRERMGTWIALTTCCVVACVSSTRVWRSIASFREYKIGQHYRDDDEYEMNVEDDAWAIITADDDNPIEFLPVMFLRTKISVAMGLGGAALGIMAILAHWYEGYGYYKNNSFHYNFGDDDDTTAHKRPYNVALLFELFVGVCTTALFGIGGWFVTGSGGPAQSVGNLYYATMITFLLSLRVVVGCVEELIEAHEVHDGIEEEFELQKIASFGLQNFSNDDGTYVTMNDGDNASIMLPPTTDMTNYRPGDLRKWGAIAMFSSVNLGSVIDGIYNMDFSPPDDDAALAEWTGGLDKDLQWMILAPSIAITVSSVFFLLCLFPQSYSFISKYRFSTPAAILTFACWCSNLIVTMHSHSSLAVNGRGEIITANQYYFSWASCSTSFLNMLGYLRRGEPESVLAILWSAILKISLVMVSASVHVWGNIKDECLDEDGAMIMDNASHQNFCQRTRFSLTAAYVGTVISLAALVLRIWVFRCFAILELVASVVMMGLFTYGTYYVTSIDGPGQVVGDLYYATWIVLICSLVIGESCWEQFSEMFLKKPEVNDFNVAGSPSKESEETTSTSSSQFVAAQLTTF